MIAYLAKKISSFFIARKYIKENETEIYNYSFEMLMAFLLNFIVLFVLACITDSLACAIAFVIGFIPLRMLAGGYHAKNHMRCMGILVLTYLVCVVVVNVYPDNWMQMTSIGLGVLTMCAVYRYAPLEDAKHPLEEEQVCELKVKSRRCVVLVISIICILSFLLNEIYFSFLISLGCLTVALSLYVSANISKGVV